METLGQSLKCLRGKHGLTQSQAAMDIGIEQSYLSKLESDQAWASLEVLKRICAVYRTDVASLLSQVDQHSLRGNLQYQGFLQRRADQKRRTWIAVAGLAMAVALGSLSLMVGRQDSTVVASATHVPVSLKFDDIEGTAALQLAADFGNYTIEGLDQVEGRIEFLELHDQPLDAALATIARELGFRVEIRGATVELIPARQLLAPEPG